MPLPNQLRNRLQNADTTAQTGRDVLTALGFAPHSPVLGWVDVLC
jgi:hypothetical protein